MFPRLPALAASLLLALLAAPAVAAKEGVSATLIGPVDLDARPGERITIAWKLEDARGHPFGAGGLFVRLRGAAGGRPVTAMTAGSGRFAVRVTVPDDGIGGIELGLRGWRIVGGRRSRADVLFPLENDPVRPFAGRARQAVVRIVDRARRGGAAPRAASRSACRPSSMRYAAPASLSMSKAASEAASTAARPVLAASAHTSWPEDTPSAVANPPPRPSRNVLRIVSAVSWPGVQMTTTKTAGNARRSPLNIGMFPAEVWAHRAVGSTCPIGVCRRWRPRGGFARPFRALLVVDRCAGATYATVRLRRTGRFAEIEVGDDGCGGAERTRGSGLRGLEDRRSAVDGVLELDSPVGGGNRLRARVPMA